MYKAEYKVSSNEGGRVLVARFDFKDEVAKVDVPYVRERLKIDNLGKYLFEKVGLGDRFESQELNTLFLGDTYIFCCDIDRKKGQLVYPRFSDLKFNLEVTDFTNKPLEEIIDLKALNDFVLSAKKTR